MWKKNHNILLYYRNNTILTVKTIVLILLGTYNYCYIMYDSYNSVGIVIQALFQSQKHLLTLIIITVGTLLLYQ